MILIWLTRDYLKFLDASSHRYKRVCPSVRRSARNAFSDLMPCNRSCLRYVSCVYDILCKWYNIENLANLRNFSFWGSENSANWYYSQVHAFKINLVTSARNNKFQGPEEISTVDDWWEVRRRTELKNIPWTGKHLFQGKKNMAQGKKCAWVASGPLWFEIGAFH